jgi:hypothetical protein
MSRSTNRATPLLLVAALLVQPNRVPAQHATAQVSVAAGIATDQRGVRSNALTLAPSLALEPSSQLAFQLGGNVTRYATDALSFGAGVSMTGHEPLGRFAALTLSGSANATRLHGAAPATFTQADILPALEIRLWRVALFGGLRATAGSASEEIRGSGLPVGPTAPNAVSLSRVGAGTVHGGVLTLADARKSLRLGVREDRLRIEGDAAPERNISAAFTYALNSKTALELAAGRYDSNRLIGTQAGEYVSAGVSFRFGGPTEPRLPRARGVQRQPSGTTRLSIRAPDARRVELAGDFNEWTPTAATRAANGVWYADLRIPPGQYRYAFRVNGSEWRVPDGATAVDDGLGGKSAWLTVSEPGLR